MIILRLLLKVLCAPILLAMTVMISIFIFLLALSSTILGIISGLIAIMGTVVLFVNTLPTINGIILLTIAWLISPIGLPAAAEWLLGCLGKLRRVIQARVFG